MQIFLNKVNEFLSKYQQRVVNNGQKLVNVVCECPSTTQWQRPGRWPSLLIRPNLDIHIISRKSQQIIRLDSLQRLVSSLLTYLGCTLTHVFQHLNRLVFETLHTILIFVTGNVVNCFTLGQQNNNGSLVQFSLIN